MKQRFSSFTIITIFVCLSIIGISLIPVLSVQLAPTQTKPSLSVNYSWRGASAKVIEQEVTSKLEGIINTVKNIKELSSTSNKGKGSISISFKKNSDMDAIRFEIANLLRQSYADLPEGVSYPQLSLSSSNENKSPILSYSINANESPYYIKKYTENNISPKIAAIKGVNKVVVNGAAPYEWVIQYNADRLLQLHISVNEIEGAIRLYFEKQQLGSGKLISETNNSSKNISLVLTYKLENEINWEHIPIKKIENRIIYLKDIANIKFKEASVSSYYRINGLNSISLTIYAEKGVNTIDVTNEVKDIIASLKNELAAGYSMKLTQDTTEYVVDELKKIKTRMLFSLLILLILIIVINRSFKYVTVLFLSIVANLLIAVIFYYAFKVELQLYSFAGITISFGIIIDNSIIMIDHIRNKGNKKAFLAILAATLTTVGALLIVFLLEESQRINLWDFALVISINIGISLFVSLYFVPALLDKMNMKSRNIHFSRKRKRRVLKFTRRYYKMILILKRPRFKWVFIMLLLLGFGIPIHLLPNKMEGESLIAETYNKTIGTDWFFSDVKPTLEKIMGGSLRLFTEHVYENSYYSEPERTRLRVAGSMPEGCTIEQLNEVTQKMENYISSFEEVELFETRISSYKNASISIYFKEAFEFGGFPFTLKSLLESKAISLGGLDWSVSGVGRGFSNSLGSGYKNNRILLEGYNYDKLYSYAELLKEQLIENSNTRVKEVEITSGSWRGNTLHEYYLVFDNKKMALANVSQSGFYNHLKNQVHSNRLTSIVENNEMQSVKLVADKYKKFNVWDLKNTPIVIGQNQYKLNQLASIEKKKTGNTISKINQQYRLTVAYDFIGTAPLAKKVRKENIEILEAKLPIGYKVFEQSYRGWNKSDKKQYYYLFVVILVIFFICSILLESIKQPLAIISMIPVAFIGVFLTFYFFDFNFDQGGYASFILLCGISVNSALYIMNDFNNLKRQYPNRNFKKLYFKAYNYKITPVILTIISTIVGLVPFIWDGQKEVFWFSFAVGSIGGLVFSLIGIVIYLPLFMVKRVR
ncbi:MAG: efflux RND transporter permease subunit [Bacteroidetes bacterium]|nr:efflux RND transporter permease subunit [Bacteroidota bacterium]